MKQDIHVISRAVILDDDQILIVYDPKWSIEQRYYYLPGGHIEHAESAADAMLRELREEISDQCSIKRFLGCFENDFSREKPQYKKKCHNHEFNFLFWVEGPFKKGVIPEQKEPWVAFKWVAITELSTLNFLPSGMSASIEKWLKKDYSEALQAID